MKIKVGETYRVQLPNDRKVVVTAIEERPTVSFVYFKTKVPLLFLQEEEFIPLTSFVSSIGEPEAKRYVSEIEV